MIQRSQTTQTAFGRDYETSRTVSDYLHFRGAKITGYQVSHSGYKIDIEAEDALGKIYIECKASYPDSKTKGLNRQSAIETAIREGRKTRTFRRQNGDIRFWVITTHMFTRGANEVTKLADEAISRGWVDEFIEVPLPVTNVTLASSPQPATVTSVPATTTQGVINMPTAISCPIPQSVSLTRRGGRISAPRKGKLKGDTFKISPKMADVETSVNKIRAAKAAGEPFALCSGCFYHDALARILGVSEDQISVFETYTEVAHSASSYSKWKNPDGMITVLAGLYDTERMVELFEKYETTGVIPPALRAALADVEITRLDHDTTRDARVNVIAEKYFALAATLPRGTIPSMPSTERGGNIWHPDQTSKFKGDMVEWSKNGMIGPRPKFPSRVAPPSKGGTKRSPDPRKVNLRIAVALSKAATKSASKIKVKV